MREGAAYTLGEMDPSPKEVVPVLMSALKDDSSSVRFSAATAFWNIGKSAERAVPALISALKDQNTHVRTAAIEALLNMGTLSQSALFQALNEKDLRVFVAKGLGNLGPAARDAVPALITLLKDKDSAARRLASPRCSAEYSVNGLNPARASWYRKTTRRNTWAK